MQVGENGFKKAYEESKKTRERERERRGNRQDHGREQGFQLVSQVLISFRLSIAVRIT